MVSIQCQEEESACQVNKPQSLPLGGIVLVLTLRVYTKASSSSGVHWYQLRLWLPVPHLYKKLCFDFFSFLFSFFFFFSSFLFFFILIFKSVEACGSPWQPAAAASPSPGLHKSRANNSCSRNCQPLLHPIPIHSLPPLSHYTYPLKDALPSQHP